MLSFLRYCKLFSKVVVLFYSPFNSVWAFSFCHIHIHICYCLSYSHSNGCEMISHCGFNLHFPNDHWCWTLFMYLWAICMSSWVRCLLQCLFIYLFFYWIACHCLSWVIKIFYKFWIQVPYWIRFANIIPESVVWWFIFLMVSFEVQKFWIYMKYNLSINFLLWTILLVLYLTNCCFRSQGFSFMLSSTCFIVLALTFISRTHLS